MSPVGVYQIFGIDGAQSYSGAAGGQGHTAIGLALMYAGRAAEALKPIAMAMRRCREQ